MDHMPEELINHYNKYLIGRLKLKLFKAITGQSQTFPSRKEIRKYLLQMHRHNPFSSSFMSKFMNIDSSDKGNYDYFIEPIDMKETVNILVRKSLKQSYFLEINNCPEPLHQNLGVMSTAMQIDKNSCFYLLLFMEESKFPDYILGFVEIIVSVAESAPTFKAVTIYENESDVKKEDKDAILISLSRKILSRLSQYIEENSVVSIQDLVSRPEIDPPIDKRCSDLLNDILVNEIKCCLCIISMDKIRPFDLDFCLSYPKSVINSIKATIDNGTYPELLLYWDGGKFIMSDDYGAYLAYRSLSYKKVPAVVMGDFPNEKAEIIKIGGSELLPNIGIQKVINFNSQPESVKEWLLDAQLQFKPESPAVTILVELFIRLSHLIKDTTVKERQLHSLLLKHPQILDPLGYGVLSEVRLGDEYRVDLIMQFNQSTKRILLIELEKSNINIFTKTGRFRAEVTHATQQVEDWLRWWQENPELVPKQLDSSVIPEGLVVIGRGRSMNEDSKKRLLHLNNNRRVKVITYDDLLDQIEIMIDSLESMAI